MTILAIESTSSVCSVALGVNGQLSAEVSIGIPNVADSLLAKLVVHLLDSTNISAADLDVVAVSSGPGSFTGTRIGVSFAKGLCQTRRTRLLPVSTLLCSAQNALQITHALALTGIMVAIPTNRELYFTQKFTLPEGLVDGLVQPTGTILLRPAAEIQQELTSNTIVCGPGAYTLEPTVLLDHLCQLSGAMVYHTSEAIIKNGSAVWADPFLFEPSYEQEFVSGEHR